MRQRKSHIFTEDDIVATAGLREVAAMGRTGNFSSSLVLARARQGQLRRDRDRALRRGDSSRARELDGLLGTQVRLADKLANQLERETVVPAKPAGGKAVIRGRLTESNRGRNGLLVTLSDPAGQPLAEAVTGKRGAFELPYAPADAPRLRISDPSGAVFLEKRDLPNLPAGGAHYIELKIDGIEPKVPPQRPPGDASPSHVTTPKLKGLAEREARAAARALGLAMRKTGEVEVAESGGRIVEQDPVAGRPIESGGTIKVVLGVQAQQRFPDLTGKSLRTAFKVVDDIPLAVDKVELVKNAAKAGKVQSHFPDKGGQVSPRTRVILRVASGADDVDIVTAALLFARHRQAQKTGLSETTLRNRLRQAKIATSVALLALTRRKPPEFAKSLRIKEQAAARVLQQILGEIAKKFTDLN